MADYRRGSFIYAKDRLLVPAEFGVGTAPDERPGGIPADLGAVAEHKTTVDVATGYSATWRGTILKTGSEGLVLSRGDDPILGPRGASDCERRRRGDRPVYSVVGLLANFVILATLYLTLNAEFICVIQIIVYTGAILVLFVFVISCSRSGTGPFAEGPNRMPRALVPAVIVVLAGFAFFIVRTAARLARRAAAARGDVAAGPGRRRRRFRQRRRFRHRALLDAPLAV